MPKLTFCDQEVSLKLSDRQLALPAGYRRKVEAYWDKISDGGRFFNGPVLAVSKLDIDRSPPKIDVSATDYAHYLCAMSDGEQEFPCPSVFAAAVVVTRDNHLLVGRMAGHTSSPGQIQCPGGGIELASDGTLDAGRCCRREVAEELGIGFLEHQKPFKPLCIKTGGRLETIGLLYLSVFDGDVKKAQLLFQVHQDAQLARDEKPEFDRLLAVSLDPQSVEYFIARNEGTVVDYLATLLNTHRGALLAHIP